MTTMSPSHLLPLVFVLLVASVPISCSAASVEDDLVSELRTLRARSPSGVIRLNDGLVNRFLTSAPKTRPYSLLIFFDAAQLRDKPDLHLPRLRSEFAILSTSFSSNNAADADVLDKLFFCDIEFSESQRSFSLFSVSSLPHVRLISPSSSASSSTPMDQSAFSRLAESMADFVEAHASLRIHPIRRPPPISSSQAALLLALLALAAPFAIRRVLRGETLLHDSRFWMFSVVFVYFFSVSGAMHNVIRKMPMFLADRSDPSKIVFFYQGSGMQLGAEGFAVGSLYTVVGLAMAFVTHLLVRVRSPGAQKVMMLGAMVISAWAVRKVIYLDNWKTGYRVHAYWPSNWR